MEKTFQELVEAREKAAKGEYDMSGYHAGVYYDLQRGNFSFECNVFNIEDCESEVIPDNLDGWYAVMLDIHN